jgi:Protein involved in formate dehydrogenase formation
MNGPWEAHRARAEALRDRHPFAAEALGCYLANVDVWQDVWDLTRADGPSPEHLPRWTVENVLPRVMKATESAGPEALVEAASARIEAGGIEQVIAEWLAGGELPPVERYLARACTYAPLLALDDGAGAACADDPSPRGGQRCPRCGGPPQLSFRSQSDDRLVSGRRQLSCARCGHSWQFSSSACPSCGETEGAKRTVYSEQRNGPVVGRDDGASDGSAALFPQLRIDACAACQRYLMDVDLGRDARAVPEVDELAAIPLALYATDQGLTKITPNLMGF